MSALTATQIPKPADEQAFERANEILWRCLLADQTVKLHGRRGQKQDGVDLYGIRAGAPDEIVGVQCKLKGEGNPLELDEVRSEVAKALGFRPSLSEYIIVTTALDDAKLERLALELSTSVSAGREKPLKIRIYCWAALEREIRRFPEALNAFDPSHTPHGDQLLSAMESLPSRLVSLLGPRFDDMVREIRSVQIIETSSDERIHSVLEAEISGYSQLIRPDPETAMSLLRGLQVRLDSESSGRIQFRIEANIAACQLELGQEAEAIAGLLAAYEHDPDNPKAAANKALALRLKGDWTNLKPFAIAKLARMPDNAALAGHYIQAAIGLETLAEIEETLPEPVKSSPEVAIARVNWAMEDGDPDAWRQAAILASANHPEDEALSEIRANALLEGVISAGGASYGRILTEAERADVAAAAAVLQRRWHQLRGYKIAESRKPISVPLNLTLAYRLLHDADNAIDIALAAVDWAQGNAEVVERAAAALLENGRRDQARKLLGNIGISQANVMMRLNLALEAQDWEAVAALVDEHIDVFPPDERDPAHAAMVIANVEMTLPTRRKAVLEANRTVFTHDPRGSAILAQSARIHGYDELAEAFFDAAKTALDPDSSFAACMAVADEAMCRAQPGAVADILLGRVDPTRDGVELRLLADALAHDFPIRERAKLFFQDLDASVRRLPQMQRIEAVYHLNRGAVGEAIPLLQSAFAQDRELATLTRLIVAHLRIDETDAVSELMQTPGLESVSGGLLDRIKLAQIMMKYGERQRAMELGYAALTEATDRPDIVLRFFGLVLEPVDDPLEVSSATVGAGAWVRLSREGNAGYEAIIGEDADRLWGQKADVNNGFVAKAIGLSVGETFEQVNGIGGVEVWTISEIKPRWLRAFHFLSESFSQRFPESKGFYMLSMQDGDPRPTLEQVRRYSEAVREHANAYLEQNIPMALVAGDRTGGAVGFADYLVGIGEEVRTCNGDSDELAAARRLIDFNEQRGAVLDALTAWRAAEMDCFDALRTVLGPLSLPATELSQLKELVDLQKDDGREERMSLGYHDGQYYREITSAEQLNNAHRLMLDRLTQIEAACEIEPVVIPDSLPSMGELLLQFPAADAMAPAIMAGEERLLLSDDMMMRRLAKEVLGTNAVWTQPVLISALEHRKISLEQYGDNLVLLAAHRHGFLTTNVDVLFSIFERDTTAKQARFQTVLQYLGNRSAAPRTHLEIACALINTMWANHSRFDVKMQAATGLVLSTLLTRHRGGRWADWAAHLVLGLDSEPKAYLVGWLRGHFMPLQAVNDVIREAEQRQTGKATPPEKTRRKNPRRTKGSSGR